MKAIKVYSTAGGFLGHIALSRTPSKGEWVEVDENKFYLVDTTVLSPLGDSVFVLGRSTTSRSSLFPVESDATT